MSRWAAATHRATRRDAALPAPATGRAQTCSRAAGRARVLASGLSDGGQAEARSAGTRARRDRRHRRPGWAQGSRGRKMPQTLPSSSPAPVGRQAGRRGQWPGRMWPAPPGCLPELPQHRASLLGPAGLAPFFRHPYPSGSSQPPPHTFPGPGAPPQTQVESTALSPAPTPGAGLEAHSGKSRGGESIFSLLFFSSIKRIKNPCRVCVASPCGPRGGFC